MGQKLRAMGGETHNSDSFRTLFTQTDLCGKPLDAGDAAAVLDVVDHGLAVEIVDAGLAVDAAAQDERVHVGPGVFNSTLKNVVSFLEKIIWDVGAHQLLKTVFFRPKNYTIQLLHRCMVSMGMRYPVNVVTS
jgi:hypothetical protein